IVIEVNMETVADQTRRHAVEHAPQDEAATRGHQDARLLIIGRSSLGERLQGFALDLDALAVAGVAPSDHLINEAAVAGEMLEAREGQPEVIEPVIERLTCDGDTEPAHVGEIGQPHPPWRVLLAENHIPVGTVERPPSGDAALQRPPDSWRDPGIATAHLLE